MGVQEETIFKSKWHKKKKIMLKHVIGPEIGGLNPLVYLNHERLPFSFITLNSVWESGR